MKYFEILVDENYIPPCPIEWYGKLDKKALEGKKVYELPRHYIFSVERHQQMVFTDIITFPCFMISEKLKEIIQKYDPHIRYTRIIFYDRMRGESKEYYLPILEEREDERKAGSSLADILILKQKNIENSVIFAIRQKQQTRIIMRIDLLESILRRDAIGIGINEIKVGG